MRILVVGAGSTGGYLGARLAQAGRDVTFLVRPGRAAQLRADGLRVVSPHGDVHLAPRLALAGALPGAFDVVLLTVKAMALEQAIADMAPAVGPGTAILPVLNGMRHMDLLRERFSGGALAGCAFKIATIVDADGRIVQLTPLQDFAYGELNGAATARMAAIDAAFRVANVGARLSPDITGEMWRKWVLLASVGAITCLMRGHVGQVLAAPGGEAVVGGVVAEVVAVVAAEGHPPSEDFVAATLTQLTDTSSTQTSSMFRDLSAGRPVEADQILGDLLERGRRAGLATPLLAAATAHLGVYARQVAA